MPAGSPSRSPCPPEIRSGVRSLCLLEVWPGIHAHPKALLRGRNPRPPQSLASGRDPCPAQKPRPGAGICACLQSPVPEAGVHVRRKSVLEARVRSQSPGPCPEQSPSGSDPPSVQPEDLAGEVVRGVGHGKDHIRHLFRPPHAAGRDFIQERFPVSYTHLDVYKRQRWSCGAP